VAESPVNYLRSQFSVDIRQTPILALLLIGALLPLLANLDSYALHLLSVVAIGSILALGLQLLVGGAGLLSIGQAAFFGVGAYTSAILTLKLKQPFLEGFFCAGVMAAITSLLMVPITRLRGAYLAVATLGFTSIVYLVLKNEDWLTGGAFGMMNIPRPSLFGIEVKSRSAVYYLCFSVLAIVSVAMVRLQDSRFGRAIDAIRQDEVAAQACGVSLVYHKSVCFIIAALVSGFAGALYAHEGRYLNPNDFDFAKSMDILIMIVIGGIGSMEGAILGAAVVVLLPEYLHAVSDYRMLVYGAVIVGSMLVGSGGLASPLQRLVARLSDGR
jgi:branched-chain amino acid transport system permease protein